MISTKGFQTHDHPMHSQAPPPIEHMRIHGNRIRCNVAAVGTRNAQLTPHDPHKAHRLHWGIAAHGRQSAVQVAAGQRHVHTRL